MENKKVIIVTDGDKTAHKAVERACNNLNLEIISESAGNPTPYSGKRLVEMIKDSSTDPVVVMVDDEGDLGYGSGEEAMETIVTSEEINLLGIIAVASNSKGVKGIKPTYSITKEGELLERSVNKQGEIEDDDILEGDTVDIINRFDETLIIGIGDLGKMDGFDDEELGAPITTKALEEIIKRGGINEDQ